MKVSSFKKSTIAAAVSTAMVLSMSIAQADGSTVSIGSYNISASATVSGTPSIQIRIGGPDGYRDTAGSNTGNVTWDAPTSLSDGQYRYEVFVMPEEEGSDQTYRETGSFNVDGGSLSPRQEETPGPQSSSEPSSLLGRIAMGRVDLLIPSAAAADIFASDTAPSVYFDDTQDEDTTPSWDWEITTNGGASNTDAVNTFYIYDWENSSRIFDVTSSGNSDNTFDVNSLGDISMANSSVFIDKSANWVGIGTSVPANDLHISGTDPTIRLDDAGFRVWEINSSAGSATFDIRDMTSANSPFVIEGNTSLPNMLVLDSANNVGMGTAAPTSALHVYRTNGTAAIKVEEASGTTASRTLYSLINRGPVSFRMQNTVDGTGTWFFSTQTTGFQVNLNGTGGPEFQVFDDGGAQIGPGGAASMRLYANGNMTIAGTLTQGSSRAIKENINVVEGGTVLAKLDALPVNYWNYKNAEASDRHVGPMAEDFYASFKLGADDKHIAPGDMAGVAIAGVKELHNAIKDRDQQIDELTDRLAILESIVNQLARKDTNDKVASLTLPKTLY